ncbi:MAG: ATP-binding protein [Deltaproteobacteria bacterium]|jgi:hypothetical protein|nr:ATP-binding protein [Deltaproteobacteria bacterium]
MALKFIKPDADSRMTCLVIGKPGIGKTSLLRTLPEEETAFTVSAESGLLCVQDLVASGQVQGAEVDCMEDLDEILTCLKTPAYRERYSTVFIDSLSEISQRCLDSSRWKFPARKDSFNLWDDYEVRMTALVKAFRDLQGYDVVMTCLETLELDEAKRRIVSPDVAMKRLKGKLAAWFDEVFYMSDAKDAKGAFQRVFYTQPFNGQPGKDRSGRLDPVEKPDLAWIRAKIFG